MNTEPPETCRRNEGQTSCHAGGLFDSGERWHRLGWKEPILILLFPGGGKGMPERGAWHSTVLRSCIQVDLKPKLSFALSRSG